MNHQPSTDHTLTFTKLIIARDHSKCETRVCCCIPPRVGQVAVYNNGYTCSQHHTIRYSKLIKLFVYFYCYRLFKSHFEKNEINNFVQTERNATGDNVGGSRDTGKWQEIENELNRLVSCFSLGRTASDGVAP